MNEFGNPIKQARWRDRFDLQWNVIQEDIGGLVEWRCTPSLRRMAGGRCTASVQTVDPQTRTYLDAAKLLDVRVHPNFENRGVGSMLVRMVIEECKRRGNRHIWGVLSEVARDHFDKLEHFYKKLGFSVTFCDQSQGLAGGRIDLDISS